MKDSFILYTEQKEVIDKLTDEQAGKLIKAIYEYVETDKMPQLDSLLEIVIIPFKQNIDRNIDKWEQIKQKRSEAGKIGAEIKKQKQAKQANVNFAKSKETNQAVNVNENVNVNDNDNVNVKDKKIHFADYVTMTNAEYEKLVSTYSKEFADQCITVLDNYKGANGKKYKSDYRAILNWVVDKVKQEQAKAPKKQYEQRQYNDFDKFYSNM